ncbi:hypothetical protein Syun_026912 [Stephania yunnanensis]|uniref:Uncharacterized protein n=1 Tax=Stephania yunnanensis TaxID=152371 RepID=A0AAP0EEN2_9MAGN
MGEDVRRIEFDLASFLIDGGLVGDRVYHSFFWNGIFGDLGYFGTKDIRGLIGHCLAGENGWLEGFGGFK